jgi:hypothetical protein
LLELSEVPSSSDDSRSFKKRSVCHYRFFFVTRVQRETTTTSRDLVSIEVESEILEIIVAEKYGFVSMEPRKSFFFIIVNKSHFGMGLRTALSMDSD